MLFEFKFKGDVFFVIERGKTVYEREKKTAKIKNRYNQVPHLTRGTVWTSARPV